MEKDILEMLKHISGLNEYDGKIGTWCNLCNVVIKQNGKKWKERVSKHALWEEELNHAKTKRHQENLILAKLGGDAT